MGLNLGPKCVNTHRLCDSGHVTWSFSLESGDNDCARSDIKYLAHSGHLSARAQTESVLWATSRSSEEPAPKALAALIGNGSTVRINEALLRLNEPGCLGLCPWVVGHGGYGQALAESLSSSSGVGTLELPMLWKGSCQAGGGRELQESIPLGSHPEPLRSWNVQAFGAVGM